MAHGAAEGPATATTDAAATGGGRSYTWLKWTAAVVRTPAPCVACLRRAQLVPLILRSGGDECST